MMAEKVYKNTIIAYMIPTFKRQKEISSSTLRVITGMRLNELEQSFIIFTPNSWKISTSVPF